MSSPTDAGVPHHPPADSETVDATMDVEDVEETAIEGADANGAQEEEEEEPQQKKRKRGRPRKAQTAEPPPRRPRGRPPNDPQQHAAKKAASAARKAAAEASGETVKRGRPKKSKDKDKRKSRNGKAKKDVQDLQPLPKDAYAPESAKAVGVGDKEDLRTARSAAMGRVNQVKSKAGEYADYARTPRQTWDSRATRKIGTLVKSFQNIVRITRHVPKPSPNQASASAVSSANNSGGSGDNGNGDGDGSSSSSEDEDGGSDSEVGSGEVQPTDWILVGRVDADAVMKSGGKEAKSDWSDTGKPLFIMMKSSEAAQDRVSSSMRAYLEEEYNRKKEGKSREDYQYKTCTPFVLNALDGDDEVKAFTDLVAPGKSIEVAKAAKKAKEAHGKRTIGASSAASSSSSSRATRRSLSSSSIRDNNGKITIQRTRSRRIESSRGGATSTD